MTDNVIPLPGRFTGPTEPPSPLVNDIPGQLRRLADAVEKGDLAGCSCLYVVMPQGEDFPAIFGWGDVDGRNQPLVQLELARAWFISQAFGSNGWRV